MFVHLKLLTMMTAYKESAGIWLVIMTMNVDEDSEHSGLGH